MRAAFPRSDGMCDARQCARLLASHLKPHLLRPERAHPTRFAHAAHARHTGSRKEVATTNARFTNSRAHVTCNCRATASTISLEPAKITKITRILRIAYDFALRSRRLTNRPTLPSQLPWPEQNEEAGGVRRELTTFFLLAVSCCDKHERVRALQGRIKLKCD